MSNLTALDRHTQDATDAPHQKWTAWVPEPILNTTPVPQNNEAVHQQKQKHQLKNTLSLLRKQATQQGYDEGYAAGHKEGQQQGLADGYQEGLQDGYREGYNAGHDNGKDNAQQAARRLAELTNQCATSLNQIETDIGEALITLSIRIAEQVLQRTLDCHPDAVLNVVDEILRVDTGTSATIHLYVHPDDQVLIQNYLHENTDTSTWRVLSDKSITRGGCKAKTALGDIDATLETRWQRVISAIGGLV